MVSFRLASLILASAFLASAAQAAVLEKPYSPELYARQALMGDEDVVNGEMVMKRIAAQRPYAPDLYLRRDLVEQDDEQDEETATLTLRKRSLSESGKASAMERSTPAASTWALFTKRHGSTEEDQHARGLIDDAEIEKRGRCSSDSQCSADQYCSSKKHRCYRKRDDWSSCSRDGACASGYCCESSDKCEPKRKPGKSCHGKDNACQSGYCSVVTDKCFHQAPKGGNCRVDQGCQGNLSCVNGECKPSKPSKPSHPHHPHHPSPSGSAKHPRVLQHVES